MSAQRPEQNGRCRPAAGLPQIGQRRGLADSGLTGWLAPGFATPPDIVSQRHDVKGLGGAAGLEGALTIAFTAMDRIVEIDRANLVTVVQPGVINATLKAAVADVHAAGGTPALAVVLVNKTGHDDLDGTPLRALIRARAIA